MIHETIKSNITEAMRAKDTIKLTTLRGLLSAFTNELVAKKRKPQEMLSDEEATEVIVRSVKQRKDSIEQFKKGGRDDLASAEEAELAVLELYMPKMMSEDEVREIAKKKQQELGIFEKDKIGMFTGVLMKELKGKADGGMVKTVAESLLLE
jgi:uncharacterized protein